MKFEIWGKNETECEPVRLRLVEGVRGPAVDVVSKHGGGEEAGRLLHFSSDGEIVLNSSVSKKFGFNLNSDGSIKVSARRC